MDRFIVPTTALLTLMGSARPPSTQPEGALPMGGEPFCAGSRSVPLRKDRGQRGGAADPQHPESRMERWRDGVFFLLSVIILIISAPCLMAVGGKGGWGVKEEECIVTS